MHEDNSRSSGSNVPAIGCGLNASALVRLSCFAGCVATEYEGAAAHGQHHGSEGEEDQQHKAPRHPAHGSAAPGYLGNP